MGIGAWLQDLVTSTCFVSWDHIKRSVAGNNKKSILMENANIWLAKNPDIQPQCLIAKVRDLILPTPETCISVKVSTYLIDQDGKEHIVEETSLTIEEAESFQLFQHGNIRKQIILHQWENAS